MIDNRAHFSRLNLRRKETYEECQVNAKAGSQSSYKRIEELFRGPKHGPKHPGGASVGATDRTPNLVLHKEEGEWISLHY